MKQYFTEFKTTVILHQQKIIFAFGLFLLISLLSSFASILHLTIASKSIVFSKDNDAGRGIQTATLSAWYKSNHFAPYGNLNYRVAHTLAVLTPTSVNPDFNLEEKNEAIHHYALLITNLLSLTVFCLFLAFILTERWDYTLLLTPLFLNIAVLNSAWVEFIFRVHPDHMLMLFVGLSCYWTMKYAKSQSEKDFIMAALMWGLATAVKRSTILFIPSFLFLFLSSGVNKQNFKQGLRFIGFMLLSYLVIGFPQNFGFYKHIRFLIHESHNSISADAESLKLYALHTFDQFKYLALAFIPIHLLFGKQEKVWSLKFFIFSLIALVIFLSRQMTSYHHHHPMAYAALILVMIYSGVKSLPTFNFKYRSIILCILVIGIMTFFPTNYRAFSEVYSNQMSCQNEAIETLKEVKKWQLDETRRLIREPMFPFDSSKTITSQMWGIKFADLEDFKAGLVGTKKSFGKVYLGAPPWEYDKDQREFWDEKQKFYQSIQDKNFFMTPTGQRFDKVYENVCGFQLWAKNPL